MVWRQKEKCWQDWEFGECEGQIPLLNGVVKIDLIEFVLFEQRLAGDEKVRNI